MKRINMITKSFILLIMLPFLASCGAGQEDEAGMLEITDALMPEFAIGSLPPVVSRGEIEYVATPQNLAISTLTGLYIPEDSANRRPFALVFNNDTRALPQNGISRAEVVYEVLAEGITTRLIAIFQDFEINPEPIGPLRSTRNYFAHIAANHDAIFVHHGGSPAGYSAIQNLGLQSIDGMRFDGSTIWRDAERRRSSGLEHSSVTSFQNLLERSEQLGYHTQQSGENPYIFNFFDTPTNLSEFNRADTIHINFAGSNTTTFRFNPTTLRYYKYSHGRPHIDGANGEQVSVTNLLVQITDISIIPGDVEGRRNVRLTGSGRGYLAGMGTYIPILWERDNLNSPTRWINMEGEPLLLNPGSSWVNIVSSSPVFENTAQ